MSTTPKEGGINTANVIGWVVIAACVAVAGWWYFVRETPTVPVREWHGAGGRFAMEGTVEPPLSEVNRALRAMDYGSVQLDFFELRDSSGVVSVYFDPAQVQKPETGAEVRVVGRTVGERDSGNRRFLASRVEARASAR